MIDSAFLTGARLFIASKFVCRESLHTQLGNIKYNVYIGN